MQQHNLFVMKKFCFHCLTQDIKFSGQHLQCKPDRFMGFTWTESGLENIWPKLKNAIPAHYHSSRVFYWIRHWTILFNFPNAYFIREQRSSSKVMLPIQPKFFLIHVVSCCRYPASFDEWLFELVNRSITLDDQIVHLIWIILSHF